jgi:hypothetical protein
VWWGIARLTGHSIYRKTEVLVPPKSPSQGYY